MTRTQTKGYKYKKSIKQKKKYSRKGLLRWFTASASTSASASASATTMCKKLCVKIPCDVCNSLFKSYDDLMKHERIVHNYKYLM